MAKTALELTREEWKAYDPGYHLRTNKALHDSKRRQQAWRVARKAAKLLRTQFGARKVVVFGSLAHRAWFTARSDIDLMAWGLGDQYFKAVAAMLDFSPEFAIDLVDPKMCAPTLLKVVKREGIVL